MNEGTDTESAYFFMSQFETTLVYLWGSSMLLLLLLSMIKTGGNFVRAPGESMVRV